MACRLYSNLFTLFWVNKEENIFDANHYIYKLECFLETKTYITVLCFIQPLFGDTARSLCVKTESFFLVARLRSTSRSVTEEQIVPEAALIPGGDMNRLCLCILVLTLFGYPVGGQSGWSVNVSHINVNISL